MEKMTKTYMQNLLITVNLTLFYRSNKKSDLGKMKVVLYNSKEMLALYGCKTSSYHFFFLLTLYNVQHWRLTIECYTEDPADSGDGCIKEKPMRSFNATRACWKKIKFQMKLRVDQHHKANRL